MANLHVGVNIREGQGSSPVIGITTGVSGLVGTFLQGPLHKATLVTSWSQFLTIFGSKPAPGSTSWYSVKGFFQHVGSGQLWIVRVASSAAAKASVTFQDRQGAPANTLKIEAANEGAWGGAISVTIADYAYLTTTLVNSISGGAVSAVLTSVGGLEVGSDMKFYNGTNTEYRRIDQIDAVSKTIYWTTGLTNAYTTANGVITSMEFTINVYLSGLLIESWTGLSMNDAVSFFCEKKVTSDYITVTDLKTTDTAYTDLPAVQATAQPLTSGADGLSDVDAADYQGVQTSKTGKYAFDSVPGLFRFCCPNPLLTDADTVAAYKTLVQDLLNYAYTRRNVMLYADVPDSTSVANAVTFAQLYEGRHLALFYNWGKVLESSLPVWVPPSSLAMGAAVNKDYNVGVFKSVGNERVQYITDLRYHVTESEHDTLNDAGVNVFRSPFPGSGIRVYGARTRSAVTKWRFIDASEYFNFLAISFEAALQETNFQPNNEFLWKATKRRIEAFLADQQNIGALFDQSNPTGVPYTVIIDVTNNPGSQTAQGILGISVDYVKVGTAEKIDLVLTPRPTGLTVLAA